MTSRRRWAITAIVFTALTEACGKPTYPAEFTGRWVRFTGNNQWADTLDFQPDGVVTAGPGTTVAAGSKWSIRKGVIGGRAMCLGTAVQTTCATPIQNGDTISLIAPPRGVVTLRKIR